jgi:hypothetical protein
MTNDAPDKVQILGEIRISSLNQVGESVKYNSKSGSFCLSRNGSLFDLLVHIDPDDGLVDFRDLPTLTVSFRLENGKYLGIDIQSGKAVLCSADDPTVIPESAIFQYQRRKFDPSSASIAFLSEGTELWLRHSNSKLRVCVNQLARLYIL